MDSSEVLLRSYSLMCYLIKSKKKKGLLWRGWTSLKKLHFSSKKRGGDRLFDVWQAAVVNWEMVADPLCRSEMIFVGCVITSTEVKSPAETDEAVLS